MVAFLVVCIILGLWAPPKAKLGVLVLVLAVALVAFFWLSPHRM